MKEGTPLPEKACSADAYEIDPEEKSLPYCDLEILYPKTGKACKKRPDIIIEVRWNQPHELYDANPVVKTLYFCRNCLDNAE